MDRDKFRKQIELHEGRKTRRYKDSLGIPTIGVGFNLTRSDAQVLLDHIGADWEQVIKGEQELSNEQIDKLLEITIVEAESMVQILFPNYLNLDDVRQRVLIDMAFNLGYSTLKQFVHFRIAVIDREFIKASKHMQNSLWYSQVGDRSKRLVRMMESGEDPEELQEL